MNKYLIVVDMQNDFITGVLGTPEAVKIVPSVIKKIKNFDGTIIYTQDTHQVEYLNTQEGKNLPVLHCVEGTPGWQIQPQIDELRKAKKSKVFIKDTFGSKKLAQSLARQNAKTKIDSIELIGLCSDICVISNAITIKAFLPETPLIVDALASAGVNPESHKTALASLKTVQVKVINE